MVERGEHLRFAPEAREPLGVEGEVTGENFQCDVALQRAVARTIHLAHAARADRRDDVVRAEAGADGKGHGVSR